MWARVVGVMLGVWLMAAPAVLDYAGPARINDRIIGPLVVAFAFVAIWEVTRSLRWINLALSAWLVFAPWALFYDLIPTLNSTVVGLLLGPLSAVRGKVEQRFGGGWSSLLKGNGQARR